MANEDSKAYFSATAICEKYPLVRDHVAGEHKHPGDCAAAVTQVVEWYLHFAVARELVLSDRPRFGSYFDGRIAPAYNGDDAWESAVADLVREQENLAKVVTIAFAEGLDELTWQLCEALVTFYFQRDLFAEAIAVHSVGSAAARRIYEQTGNLRPLLRMKAELGAAYFSAQDDQTALRHFQEVLALADSLPENDEAVSLTKAKTLVWKAFVYQRQGTIEASAQAVKAIEQASLLMSSPAFPELRRMRELAILDMNSIPMFSAVGRHADALAAGHRAKTYLTAGKERHNLAKTMANLGESLSQMGADRSAEAVGTLREALALEAELGRSSWEAHTSVVLADVVERAGELTEARSLVGRVIELYAALENPRAETLRVRLAG